MNHFRLFPLSLNFYVPRQVSGVTKYPDNKAERATALQRSSHTSQHTSTHFPNIPPRHTSPTHTSNPPRLKLGSRFVDPRNISLIFKQKRSKRFETKLHKLGCVISYLDK